MNRTFTLRTSALLAIAALPSVARAQAAAYEVDPNVGNSSFSAVFDAALGERINAVSSAVACTLQVDNAAKTSTGACAVALTSIKVDSNDTKTEHFGQWATNNKSDPKTCRIEMTLKSIQPAGPLAANQSVKFTADAAFTVCGRPREGGGTERITGEALLFPAGQYGAAETIRIRAHVAKFNREKYGVSPKNTSGWLSKVQALANVVAAEGDIDVNLFAKRK